MLFPIIPLSKLAVFVFSMLIFGIIPACFAAYGYSVLVAYFFMQWKGLEMADGNDIFQFVDDEKGRMNIIGILVAEKLSSDEVYQGFKERACIPLKKMR